MGVRGSVELKSINSVGGISGSGNSGSTNGQPQNNGFAWTSSSKHQQSKSSQNG